MNIIISPAKKMNIANDDINFEELPALLDKTRIILNIIKEFSYEELKDLLQCNDEIAELNYDRYKYMDVNKGLSPALLTYDGIQYKYMSPGSFSQEELDYVQKYLKILSGFYGVVRPLEGVVPYRIEMKAKLNIDGKKNLYNLWGDSIYREITKDSNVILNLASKEYSKAIEKYLKADDTFVTCIFGSFVNGKIKVKATEAKMARGLMVRYLATNNIDNLEEVKKFSDMGFKYSEEHSSENEFVFLK